MSSASSHYVKGCYRVKGINHGSKGWSADGNTRLMLKSDLRDQIEETRGHSSTEERLMVAEDRLRTNIANGAVTSEDFREIGDAYGAHITVKIKK